MAISVHLTIRLDVDLDGDGLPVNEYRVIQGGLARNPMPALVSERSLTGNLQVHRLLTGSDTLVFDDCAYELLLLSRTERDSLVGDLGEDVYLMRHVRDEADAATYREVMLLKSVKLTNIDPMLDWWRAQIELETSTGNTP